MTATDYVLCKRCKIEVTPNFKPRPDTPHAGELRCPVCDCHLKWQPKPQNENKRDRNKHTPASLGIDFCQLCMRPKDRLGKHEVLLPHHIIEVQYGGIDDPENIWVVCSACHALIHHQRTYLNSHTAQVWEKYESVKKIIDSELTNGRRDEILTRLADILGV